MPRVSLVHAATNNLPSAAAWPVLAVRSVFQREARDPLGIWSPRPPGPFTPPRKRLALTRSRLNRLPADPSPSSTPFQTQRRTTCYAHFSRLSSCCSLSEQRPTRQTAAMAGLAVKKQCPAATNNDDPRPLPYGAGAPAGRVTSLVRKIIPKIYKSLINND